jgi:hypothetical protein
MFHVEVLRGVIMINDACRPHPVTLRTRPRYEWDLCFDPMRPVREFMLILGLLLVLFGLQVLLDVDLYRVWTIVLIAVGLYIVYRSLGRRW